MATDFFERQHRSRRQTQWLRVLFTLALTASSVLVALGIVLAMIAAGLGGYFRTEEHGALAGALLNGGLWRIAIGVMIFSLLVSAVAHWSLREGGAAVARALRARRVLPNTDRAAERQLLNVVAEMSLASQVPEPDVWLLDREPCINAFAAGPRPEVTVICVTAGALKQLERDELQAMIAHEFSHILNGDTALNTRLMAWLSGLFVIENMARSIRAASSDTDADSEAAGYLALLSWWLRLLLWPLHMLGYVSLLLGRALQAAISRQREKLADASAVQFTRNPAALKTLLMKAEAVGEARFRARAALDMMHMFFAPLDGTHDPWSEGMPVPFDTQPSLLQRAQALDGTLTAARFRASVQAHRRALAAEREQARAPVAIGGESLRPAVDPEVMQATRELLASRLTREQQQAVLAVHQRCVESPHRLQAVFIAALLDHDSARASQQLLTLTPVLQVAVASQVNAAAADLGSLVATARLPLLTGLLPKLATLPDQRRLVLVKITRALMKGIAPLDTLRFAVSRLLLRELLHADAAQPPPIPDEEAQGDEIPPRVRTDPAVLLCLLVAQCSGADGARAFRHGLSSLSPLRSKPPEYTAEPVDAAAVDAALTALAAASFERRSGACAALLRVIGANLSMSVAEFDLLRMICACIGIHTPSTTSMKVEHHSA